MSTPNWFVLAVTVVAAIITVSLLIKRNFTPKLKVALTITISVAAAGAYTVLRTPAPTSIDVAARYFSSVANDSTHQTPSSSVASVATLLDGLRDRLDRQPDDADGWMLLAQSYDHLGRPHEARAAYDRAKALGKSNASLEASLPAALNSPTANTPSAGFAERTGVSIQGTVSVSADIASTLNPNDTVFIFAKESKTHRMPVVALRRPASQLPIEFELGDAQAMLAGTKVADYESLVLVARISRTGLATDDASGLEVSSEPISPASVDHVNLHIGMDKNTDE